MVTYISSSTKPDGLLEKTYVYNATRVSTQIKWVSEQMTYIYRFLSGCVP